MNITIKVSTGMFLSQVCEVRQCQCEKYKIYNEISLQFQHSLSDIVLDSLQPGLSQSPGQVG